MSNKTNKLLILLVILTLVCVFASCEMINGLLSDIGGQTSTEKFTVSFNSNGGSEVASQQVEKGNCAEQPDCSKQGYELCWWNLDGAMYDFATPVTKDIELTAVWSAKQDTPYTVEHYFKNNQEYVCDQSKTQHLVGQTDSRATAEPLQVEGFFFDSKSYDNVREGIILADGSLVLKLYYRPLGEACQVSFNSNGGSQVATQSIPDGQLATEPEQPTRTGYTFVEWQLQGVAYDFATPVETSFTLVALWQANDDTPYTVQHYFENLQGEFVIDSQATQSLFGTTDTTATAQAIARTGYALDDGNASTKASGVVTADGTLVLKLYYKLNVYSIALDASCTTSGNGYTVSIAQSSAKHGTSVEFDAQLEQGYRNLHVSYTCNGNSFDLTANASGKFVVENIGGDIVITVSSTQLQVFSVSYQNGEHYTLTVNGIGAEGVTEGESITISVVLSQGYHAQDLAILVNGVAQTVSGNGCSYVVNGNVTSITASGIVGNGYSVVYNANGASGNMESSAMVYGQSANLSANAFVKEHYLFCGWALTADGEVAYSNGQSVTNLCTEQGSQIELFAIWQADLTDPYFWSEEV